MVDVRSKDYEKFLELRPLNVKKVFSGSKVALVSGRVIHKVMKKKHAIALAANIRNFLSAFGVLRAAKKLNAAVILELAKSENGYCGVHFDNLPEKAREYSEMIGDGVVFSLHMDHFTIKSGKERDEAIDVIQDAIRKGWTSVAVDASHNPDYENLIYTRDVALHIPPYIGLETEVGEIRGKGVLTTVEEALYFIGGLNSWGVFPDYLAISNGSKHGTYDKSAGEEEGIDLNRTKEIADAISKYGVSIAQHGISGTPLDKVSKFKDYGIHKGNVGTLWQNIVFGLKVDPDSGNAIIENDSYVKDPDRGIPMELWEEMVKEADKRGYSRKSGDYKKLNIVFHDKIMNLDKKYIDRIVDETEEWAVKFLKAFNCEDTAEMVIEEVLKNGDYVYFPEVKVIEERGKFTRESAPDYLERKRKEEGDFSD
ncbi:MAG: class II fructose-bisphosphate aldolase [Caldiserica bacterium]|nr:MAG: class II fructose-bisphosphate aldolase [Caldisericota bacterium]